MFQVSIVKTIIALNIIVCCFSIATTVNVDINTNGGSETYMAGGALSGENTNMVWNGVYANTGGTFLSNALDSNGQETGIDFYLSGSSNNAWSDIGFNVSEGNLVEGFVLMNDWVFNNDDKTLIISGLETGHMYDLYLYGCGTGGGDVTRWEIDGKVQTSSLPDETDISLTAGKHFLLFNDIIPENSSITAEISNGNTGGNWAIAGLQLVSSRAPGIAHTPVPENNANGQIVPAGNISLQWINDPDAVAVDVWFGLSNDVESGCAKIADHQLIDSIAVNVADDSQYYWRVDTYLPNLNDPVRSSIFTFNTKFSYDAIPVNNQYLKTGDFNLEWINYPQDNTGSSVFVDVWFGKNEPNTKIVDKRNVSGLSSDLITVNAAEAGRYYWQINTWKDDEEIFKGDIMSFNVADAGTGLTSGIFAGGPLYYDRDRTINGLRESGFTFVVAWTIHVMNDNGDLNFNAEFPLVENGRYIGNTIYPDYANDMNLLKTAPSTINRIEFGLSAGGSYTFEHIKHLVETEGTAPGSKLYDNFSALKEAIPYVDAINFDDEMTYDADSATQFAIMLADIGYKVTLCPYTRRSFWQEVARNTNNSHPGAVDAIYLQCYDGGGGNNPCDWIGYFDDIPVLPGVFTGNLASINSKMSGWKTQCGISGGWLWMYDPISSDLDIVASHADVLNNVFETEHLPLGVSNMYPPEGRNDVPMDVTLSWDAKPYAESFDIYWGSNTVLTEHFHVDLPQTSLSIPRLRGGTTYYWAVDANNASGTVPGIISTFKTAGPREDIDGSGQVDFGDFSVFALNWNSNNSICNFDQEGLVDLPDLERIAERWLDVTVYVKIINIDISSNDDSLDYNAGGAYAGQNIDMYWNGVFAYNGGDFLCNALDSDRNESGVCFNITGTSHNAWSNTGLNVSNGNLTEGFTLMNDWVYNNDIKTLTITGLKSEAEYDLYYYGCGTGGADSTKLTMYNIAKESNVPSSEDIVLAEGKHFILFENIKPVDGTIELAISTGSSGGNWSFAGLQLIEKLYCSQ